MKLTKQILRDRKGVALLVAVFAIMFMIFIATEVSYDTSIEYVIARQQVNRLKAYYAARAGVEMSLLRILIYKKAVAALSQSLGLDKAQSILPMLDQIWQMPLPWPIKLPENAHGVDQDTLEKVNKESLLDAQFLATISSEGGKIDINDLGSASKALREGTKTQILKLFASEVEHNKDFSDKYRYFRFDEVVNNMIDWIDEDKDSLNGGGEQDKYPERNDRMPPNQSFKTMKELNMVAGMNEDLFRVLQARVTLYGSKGVNVNYASKEVIKSLDPSMNDKAVDAILDRRNNSKDGGPFKNDKDFFDFASRYGVDVQALQKSGIQLLFGVEYNFRIIADGIVSNSHRQITAVTFDIENLTTRYLSLMDKEANKAGGPTNPPADAGKGGPQQGVPAASENPKIEAPKGRPTVVYWEEN